MIGRHDELASLRAAFAAVAAGEATTVFIGGEAGVGKTRLLTEFVDDLPEPAYVVWGRCMALIEGGLPYGAFRDGLRTFMRSLDPPALDELRSHTSADLAQLVPELGHEVPRVDPSDRETEQLRMFELLLQAVAFFGGVHPSSIGRELASGFPLAPRSPAILTKPMSFDLPAPVMRFFF